jgi:GTP cyclohydrolase IA
VVRNEPSNRQGSRQQAGDNGRRPQYRPLRRRLSACGASCRGTGGGGLALNVRKFAPINRIRPVHRFSFQSTLIRNRSFRMPMNERGSRARQRAAVNGNGLAPVDLERIARAVREILLAVGEDPDREGLAETPERVARMYAEMFSGMRKDPREPLQKTFTEKYDEMVLVKDIGFESMCEHHLLPFMGKAHIAYLPNGKIVGLSKLARIVEILARRPQVQERMTEEIADLLMSESDARGVGVVLEATHTCMTIRGVRKPHSVCTSSAMRGIFRERQSSRAELMSLIFGAAR